MRAVRLLRGIAGLTVLIVAPNFAWLWTSTLRITNASSSRLESVGYAACGRMHSVGTLEPGAFAFRFLEACGDDTLEILVGGNAFCQTYVEGELYHVDATIDAADRARCRYADPISSLLVSKALW